MRHQHCILWLLLSLLFAQSSAIACTSPYAKKVLNRVQLVHLLKAHQQQTASKTPLSLCQVILRQQDLSNLDLQHIDFTAADLSGSVFIGSDLTQARLEHANLANANLKTTYLLAASLDNADLHGADLTEATLKQASLQHAYLRDTRLTAANISEANLQGANMEHVIMPRANLSGSNLTRTNLPWSNLQHTDFSYATLDHANLSLSNLAHADFSEARLVGTDFEKANLQHANFTQAQLRDARFQHSNLRHANLRHAHLHRADFTGADFFKLIYQPTLNAFPNVISLATVSHFDSIDFFDDTLGAPALTELRQIYKKAGMRRMERLVTSMVKTHEMRREWQHGGWTALGSAASYLLFHITCEFGLSPARPLFVFLLLIFLFAIPYRIALSSTDPRRGIHISWRSQCQHHHRITQSQHYSKRVCARNYRRHAHPLYQQLQLGLLALRFSLLSAFKIGWDDFNIAIWIAELQTRKYRLTATGWVRTFVGIQSIISAYLIVLWALTYFSSPFEW